MNFDLQRSVTLLKHDLEPILWNFQEEKIKSEFSKVSQNYSYETFLPYFSQILPLIYKWKAAGKFYVYYLLQK